MEIIIFQLLSCLYLYDSGILVPVRIRKQILYTGFWPVALITVPPVYRLLAVALIYRATGIPASGVQRVKTHIFSLFYLLSFEHLTSRHSHRVSSAVLHQVHNVLCTYECLHYSTE